MFTTNNDWKKKIKDIIRNLLIKSLFQGVKAWLIDQKDMYITEALLCSYVYFEVPNKINYLSSVCMRNNNLILFIFLLLTIIIEIIKK